MAIFILCIKIFFVRILDVSLGTVRTLFTVKGKRNIATFIAFFEVLIWFLIVKEALNTDETSIFIALSYSAGFATGTYIGSFISEKFIKGNLSVQAIIKRNNDVISAIRNEGYAVSVLKVEGQENDEKCMLFIEINKKRDQHLVSLIKKLDPTAFIVINDTRYIQNGFIK